MNIISQVFLAILVIIILMVIATHVYNREAIKYVGTPSSKKTDVSLFDTVIRTQGKIDTRNKNAQSYRNLPPSDDQRNGSVMSWSFWLSVNEGVPNDSDAIRPDIPDENEVVLFVKGNNEKKTFKNVCSEDKDDYLVKCPLVKLENNNTVLTVEFNTLNSPDAVRYGAPNQCGSIGLWKGINQHKFAVVIPDKVLSGSSYLTDGTRVWFMVTVVIRDTTVDDKYHLRNKIACRIYVNDDIIMDEYADNEVMSATSENRDCILRPNEGDVHILPGMTDGNDSVLLAHMKYFNYELDPGQIKMLAEQKNKLDMDTVGTLNSSTDMATRSEFGELGDNFKMSEYRLG